MLSALMSASSHGRTWMVRMLCDKGAKLDIKNQYGSTALGYAVAYRELDCVEELCKRGARVFDYVLPQYVLDMKGEYVNKGQAMPKYLSKCYKIHQVLTKQCFSHNLLVLIDHIQINILRGVHKWI